MEITIKKIIESNILIFIFASVLFLIGMFIDTKNGVNTVILLLLEFTVIFELARTFNHYLKDGQIKVRYGIDAAIFFAIKELYIGFSELKLHNDYTLITVSLIAICILMAVRYVNSTLVEEKAKLCTNNCQNK